MKKWKDLPPGRKVAVVTLTAVDAGLRVWALRDLAGRQQDEIKGPKRAWMIGLSIGSTAGIAPAIYLLWGRRRSA